MLLLLQPLLPQLLILPRSNLHKDHRQERRPQSERLFALLLFSHPIAEKHANEDEQGTEEEIERNALRKDNPSKEDGNDGIEINVVGNNDSTKFLDGPIP